MELRLSNMIAAKGMGCSIESRFLYLYIFFSHFLAISDAVRTSLGPRGMDKMVFISAHYFQKDQILIFEIDPNLKGRGDSNKRWCYYP